jgi:hypothetical protein
MSKQDDAVMVVTLVNCSLSWLAAAAAAAVPKVGCSWLQTARNANEADAQHNTFKAKMYLLIQCLPTSDRCF